jgi:hypothetical protein
MPGDRGAVSFQAERIEAVRSDRVVCVIKIGARRFKAFQVFLGKDGSLFVTFPYFRHREGILTSSHLPVTGDPNSTINLEQGGKVTSHLVKYSHHPNGRAHFSQTGKIVTAIKRQSVALHAQEGHIFSLQIQGIDTLEQADQVTDVGVSPKRTVVDFTIEPCDAIKFVARWYDVSRMRFSAPTPVIGPWVPTMDPAGVTSLVSCF